MPIPVDDARRRRINDHVRGQDESGGLARAKLIIQGRVQELPIYRFRTSDLLFNRANGRIRSSILAWESEEGKMVDPYSPDGQRVIREFLLSIREDENDKIQDDLLQNGQLQPGIVTCDGVVVNGNRRKALLEQLYDVTHEECHQYLEAHVLPRSIEKSELWLIEAGIQLSAPQQLDYSPINHLLKLREGVDSGLDIENMASRIYGVDVERLRRDLARLGLIDEYLRDYLCKPGRYYLIEGKNEHFIDLQNVLERVVTPRGVRKDWTPDESDFAELKLVAFHLIRGKFPHMRIRDLRDLFLRESSWQDLKKVVGLTTSTDSVGEEAAEEETPTEADDDDYVETTEDDEGDASLATVERDRVEEEQWVKQRKGQLKSAFQDAKEQLQIEKDREQPLALARRALRNMEAIREDSVGAEKPELDDVLRRILERTNVLRDRFRRRRKKTKKSAGVAKTAGKNRSAKKKSRKRKSAR